MRIVKSTQNQKNPVQTKIISRDANNHWMDVIICPRFVIDLNGILMALKDAELHRQFLCLFIVGNLFVNYINGLLNLANETTNSKNMNEVIFRFEFISYHIKKLDIFNLTFVPVHSITISGCDLI